eukprot:gene15975-biopygen3727
MVEVIVVHEHDHLAPRHVRRLIAQLAHPGVTGHWRGRGGHGAGVARAWRGHGVGMARAWRGRGAGVACDPRGSPPCRPASSRCTTARNGHARVRSASASSNSIVRPASGPRPVRVRCRFSHRAGNSLTLQGQGWKCFAPSWIFPPDLKTI